MTANGEFDVKMNPLDIRFSGNEGVRLGRQEISKSFQGDLNAESKGEMLTAYATKKGSAGYVAIEQVEGELNGKKGSFVLQHFGVMQAETERLILEVVPDSGTGELSGLSGSMEITVTGDVHSYRFDYEL